MNGNGSVELLGWGEVSMEAVLATMSISGQVMKVAYIIIVVGIGVLFLTAERLKLKRQTILILGLVALAGSFLLTMLPMMAGVFRIYSLAP
jgi:hypothetical protein